jgi:mannose-6-phosphate isomerase-like protein (cupin superfamily)
MERVDLEAAFAAIGETWSPRVVAAVNDVDVKLVRFAGRFEWHHHEREDELFLVVKGRLTMRFRERAVELGPGQMIVVPRGVEHLPEASEECWVMLVEPRTTLRRGNLEAAQSGSGS